MSNADSVNDVTAPRLIDPDPYSGANIAIATVSGVANFLMLWRGWNAGRPSPTVLDDGSRQQLSSLEDAVEKLTGEMRQVTRAIERGSPNPDAEFYDAPLRVGKTQMHLQIAEHQD